MRSCVLPGLPIHLFNAGIKCWHCILEQCPTKVFSCLVGGRIDGIEDNVMLKFRSVVGKALNMMYQDIIKDMQGVG